MTPAVPSTTSAQPQSAPRPQPLPTIDLSHCDREPIHIPGAVQPHGILMAVRESDLTILQVNDNTDALVGVPAAALLGRSLDTLFGREQVELLRRSLAGATGGGGEPTLDDPEGSPLYLFTAALGKGPARRAYSALFHWSDGVLVLDLEPAESGEALSFRNLHPLVRSSIARLTAADDVAALCRLAAEEVRRVTGFDRVMVYRFDENWNGEVVAEDKAAELPPFLGLHYPASDIPAQARELYRLNRQRLIADVHYRPSRLVPQVNPETRRPLDLSHSTIRSVSPVHVEYLKNMGVGASMSVSILRDDAGEERQAPGQGPRLWGLIACHHRTPRYLPYEVRTACDFLGQVLALQLAAKEVAGEAVRRLRLKNLLTRLLQHMAQEGPDKIWQI